MSEIPSIYRTPAGLTSELRATLLAQDHVTLATINPDGSPHMTNVWFMLDEAGLVYLAAPAATRKVKNVMARPRATVLAGWDSGWISATGSARVIRGEEAARINRRIQERLLTEAGMATLGEMNLQHEDVSIEISPTKWLSWTSDEIVPKLQAEGVDLDENPPSTWFKDLTSDD